MDKGEAVRKLRRVFGLTSGVLFMGDSSADNPAFLASDISIGVGVDNSEGNAKDLASTYFVSFDSVPKFLGQLLDNNLFFDSSASLAYCHNSA